MTLPITALYAALLTLLFLFLTQRVIASRRALRADLGFAGDRLLERRVRAHGNFAENVPLALVMLAVLETGGWPALLLHALGIALIAGRLVHAYAFSVAHYRATSRVVGVATTIGVLVTMAGLCLVQALGAL